MRPLPTFAFLLLAAVLPACAETSRIPDKADVGPNPTLVEPVTSIIPTIQIAEAKGWQPGTKPVAAQGLKVNALVTGLDHPRWIHVLPNGDVLVAESRAPERPEDSKGFKAKVMGYFMKKAGSAGKSANRITLLRDADGDGVAEVKSVFLENLNSPFGMALVGDQLYIANTDAVVRVPYKEGETRITAQPVKLADLPGGSAQPPLDQGPHRQPRRLEALRHRGLEQQRGRARHGRGRGPRRHLGNRHALGRQAPLRHGTAQSQRDGLGALHGNALDRGERARRAGQRPRARLPHLRA
jgi:hypothetical protein